MSVVGKPLVVFVISCMELISAAKILAIFPLPFRDHQMIFRPLIEELAKRDHHLTVLTTDPVSFDIENVDSIDLSFANNLNVLNELIESGQSGSDMLRTVFRVMRTIAEAELKSRQVQMLFRNDTESFDAVLVDWSGPSLMNGFAYYFRAPLIGITSGEAYITSHEAVGNPNHPAVFSNNLLPFSENLSLLQRIMGTFFSIWHRYLYLHEELPAQHEIAKDFFGSNTPDLWEIEKNVDLLLINNYQALGNARPVGPTTVHLGGIHASSPRPLPVDLKDFLTQSIGVVVYINLGAMTKDFVQTGRIERLINILEESSLGIVWNTNGFPTDVNTTARIFHSSVMSQEDVLRHEKVQLFITVGGQRDVEDAVHFATPVLGLTFSSNLEHYLQQIAKYEAGIVTNFDRESNDVVLAKINELQHSSKYKSNMARLSATIRDQPQTSLERAAWWIEYVIRHDGTKHLRHSLRKLSWSQYLLLDVFAAVAVAIIIAAGVLAFAVIRIRQYSKSLPFERVTSRAKQKLL